MEDCHVAAECSHTLLLLQSKYGKPYYYKNNYSTIRYVLFFLLNIISLRVWQYKILRLSSTGQRKGKGIFSPHSTSDTPWGKYPPLSSLQSLGPSGHAPFQFFLHLYLLYCMFLSSNVFVSCLYCI